jgi:hypothetical protein
MFEVVGVGNFIHFHGMSGKVEKECDIYLLLSSSHQVIIIDKWSSSRGHKNDFVCFLQPCSMLKKQQSTHRGHSNYIQQAVENFLKKIRGLIRGSHKY